MLERVKAHMKMRKHSCGHWQMVARSSGAKQKPGRLFEGLEYVHSDTPKDC
jgi:hypothetical protein